MSLITSATRLCVLASLLAAGSSQAVLFTVGAADDQFGCTHTSIAAALQASQLNGPELDHIIVTNSAGYAGQALRIVNQSVEIRGGFSSCGLGADEFQPYAQIGGNGTDPLLRIEPSASGQYEVRLVDLRLSGGGSPEVDGGAIQLRPGTLTYVKLELIQTELSGNRAYRGGGIYAQRGPAPDGDYTVLLRAGTRILDNTATGSGGGLNISGSALHIEAHDVRIAGNSTAGAGGGIYFSNGTLLLGNPTLAAPRNDVSGALVEGNSAGTLGGGIYLSGSTTLMEARELIVEGNSAPAGGGIAAANGAHLQLLRDAAADRAWYCPPANECTRLSNNRAGDGVSSGTRGGALALYSGAVAEISQAVIRDNRAQDAAAVLVDGASVLRTEGVLFTGHRTVDLSGQASALIRASYLQPSTPPDLRLAYSTFAGNTRLDTGNTERPVADLIGQNGTTLAVYSSAFFDSPYGWTMYNAHTSDCSVVRDGGGLPATGTHTRSTTVPESFNPRVFLGTGANRNWRPRFDSPLTDVCDSSAYTARYRDRDLRPRCRDEVKPDLFGACDAGAWENDQLFADNLDPG
jgi:hypothetical protein